MRLCNKTEEISNRQRVQSVYIHVMISWKLQIQSLSDTHKVYIMCKAKTSFLRARIKRYKFLIKFELFLEWFHILSSRITSERTKNLVYGTWLIEINMSELFLKHQLEFYHNCIMPSYSHFTQLKNKLKNSSHFLIIDLLSTWYVALNISTM
jgi:hypothetical protein